MQLLLNSVSLLIPSPSHQRCVGFRHISSTLFSRCSLGGEREWWDFHFHFIGNAFLSCSDGFLLLIRYIYLVDALLGEYEAFRFGWNKVSPSSMKPGSKKGGHSITPLPLRSKSVTNFRLFPEVKSTDYDPGRTHVYLNVYDLTPANGYFYWAGLGVFHTGIEVHGVEYGFGAHDYPTTGVFEVEPRKCPGFKFKKSIFMGTTYLDPFQFREFMEYQSSNYNGDTYHLIVKNCNHFCEDICYKLTGNRIPRWVNRLARIGLLCNYILPKALKTSAVRHDPNFQGYGIEKKRLTRSFSCFSSISMHQRERQVSISSLFLHSQYKGCLPPWELKKSRNGSSEEE